MELLIRAALVFFATLLAAALLALGKPLIDELVSRGETRPAALAQGRAPVLLLAHLGAMTARLAR